MSPKKYYAYVGFGFGKNVSMYEINSSTGQLTALSPATIGASSSAANPPSNISTLTIGANSYAYAVNAINGTTISMYAINSSTGQLTALSPATVDVSEYSRAMSTITIGINRYAYVPSSNRSIVSMFAINNSTGQLTALSPATIGIDLYPYSISTLTIGANSYAYVSSARSALPDSISMFAINSSTGQLTALSPATIDTGSLPYHISTITIGTNSYAYTLNTTSSNISMFAINNSNGQLTALSPATIGTSTSSRNFIYTLTIGTNSYAYTMGDGAISMYEINSSTGQLTALSPATIGTGQRTVFMTTQTIGTNTYAYVCNSFTNNSAIFMYEINSSTGQLTALSPASIITGISPNGILPTSISTISF